jgi:hypothetical protein
MHEMVRESWMRFNEPLEGIVNFMYLDVKGWSAPAWATRSDETVRRTRHRRQRERQASLRLANQLNWYDQAPAQPLHQPRWRRLGRGEGTLDLARRDTGPSRG